MRISQYLLNTTKETPADAEIVSHQLMLRAGLIRRLGSGLYSWLPLGLRVLSKVSAIVRKEMENAGVLEILMPSVQPADLWQESGRWDKYGPLLLKMQDRHQRQFCFGPTHEEVITDIMRKELRSYKQLPRNVFQIQTKFRDEIRPRFGVMRAREFIMKDAYSFHTTSECLEQTYHQMHAAYCKVFQKLDLNFRPVLADTGDIGGSFSHEFQVLADSGEDLIAHSDGSDYAANIEQAEALPPQTPRPAAGAAMQQVATPNQRTIQAVCDFLQQPTEHAVKTLIVKGSEQPLVALILRGDHELNPLKAAKLPSIQAPLEFASEQDIEQAIGCPTGYIGPVGLELPMIVDHSAAHLADFICGANTADQHRINVNWERDVALPETADLRNVVAGDPSPDGKGQLQFSRGIEVGHIFQLGDKYSQALNCSVLDENGKPVTLQMGCYGMGISRIVAAAIEQNHDDKGIIWTKNMAPFQVILIPIQMAKSPRLEEKINQLYADLKAAGIDVLLDDRNERPGVMFSDADLIGIPHRLVLGERALDKNIIEYKHRRADQAEELPLQIDLIIEHIKSQDHCNQRNVNME